MRSRRKQGTGSPGHDWLRPLPGSPRGNAKREATEVAFLEAYEQTPLTNWQTHQWEKAMNAKPKVLRNGRLVRPLLERYPFSRLERRGTLENV
jgi:hypothetical protein